MAWLRSLKRRSWKSLFVFFTIITIPIAVYVFLEPEFDFAMSMEAFNETTEDGKCTLPYVDPFRPDIMYYVRNLKRLKCEGKRYGRVEGKTIVLRLDGIKKAEMMYIRRRPENDFEFEMSEKIPLDTSKKELIIHPKEDFVKLLLTTKDNDVVTEFHNLIVPIKEVLGTKISERIEDLGLNIVFLMLDSVSAASFKRLLPQSTVALQNTGDTIFFKGHTIVGDGTTAQLCAILTGKNEQFLPEARRSFPDSQPVDRWPFIFKDFKKKGYVTLFQEDSSLYGAFTYRLQGFKNPPTDHYARPYYMAAQKETKEKDDICFGSLPTHMHVLTYLESFHATYKDIKKISLSIIANLPHKKFDLAQRMDDDLAKFIRDFDAKGYLDNTMFILFSDHGSRFSGSRWSLDGKLEERLPHLSITFPKWFKKRHRNLFAAMTDNANILTSHYDHYATLKHMLSFPVVDHQGTGQSLFTKIDPETRNCKSAGVADHWCPCLGYVNISTSDSFVSELARIAVAYINTKLGKNGETAKQCAQLALKDVVRAGKVVHNWKMESFAKTRKNSRCDSCVLLFKKNRVKRRTKYEIVLRVEPSDALFEVNLEALGSDVTVDPNISRVNKYGSQSDCVASDFPHLREFCYCKNT